MENEEKRILDSVHGNIYIDRTLVERIIDTPEFQRLRRVEQTSTRAIFPSARHDRFIHSLGVYYIGTLIVKQLEKTGIIKVINEDLFKNLSQVYLIACLLHDIGHAPFSHTFEKYFGTTPVCSSKSKDVLKKNVLSEVRKLYRGVRAVVKIQKEELFNIKCDSNYHELTSALITIAYFKEVIPSSPTTYNNVEFAARMIIGCPYQYGKENAEVQIRNCFIDLLHGGIIDADRLDYVCRDVWASGYSTSTVDVERLISGLFIEQDKDNIYQVCFHANVLNEIESVLDVKDFQVKYILNHHTVLLEQYFLEQAALQMALRFTNRRGNRSKDYALASILCRQALSKEGVKLSKISYNGDPITIRHMADDDLVSLMKLDNNDFYKKWSSRNYNMVALWKTRDEFFYYFELPRNTSFGDEKEFSDVIMPILRKFKIYKKDVLCLKAEYKPRVELDTLRIHLSDKGMVNYTQLYRESNSIVPDNPKKDKSKKQIFFYVYIDSSKMPSDRKELKERKIEIMSTLKASMELKYQKKQFLENSVRCNTITCILNSIKHTKLTDNNN